MKFTSLLAVIAAGFLAAFHTVAALGVNDAEDMYNAFNKAFLTSNAQVGTFYRKQVNSPDPDGTWGYSLDILGAMDAYERTGDADKRKVVDELCASWLKLNPMPWTWDGWNDDIGWFTLGLIRGYQMTGTTAYLQAAEYGFNMAFARGWDTQHNNGGIWEEDPDATAKDNPPHQANKCALSNDSLGKVTCMIYQSTHDQTYLDRCTQIYKWSKGAFLNPTTGEVNGEIDQDGHVNTDADAYNQGTFLDFANLVWEITGDESVYNDCIAVINYGVKYIPDSNGIFSATNQVTWADEMARGMGHFIGDNKLWGTYYDFMVKNADAILKSRRPDLGITLNAWDAPTPEDPAGWTDNYVSALAWLQQTPATMPDGTTGIHIFTNMETGLALDSTGNYGANEKVSQSAKSTSRNQLWQVTRNLGDSSFNLVSLTTWLALDSAGATAGGSPAVQNFATRDSTKRWVFEAECDGSYRITNQASGLVLDGAGGGAVTLSEWTDADSQLWIMS